MNSPSVSISRRDFLRTSAFASTVGAVATSATGVFAAGSDTIRVGLVGCGARGTGAAMNCVLSSPGVVITALADVFPDRVQAALKRLKPAGGDLCARMLAVDEAVKEASR